MAELTVHLLGQFQVLLNGKAITHFATDKVRALLAYLVIENQYPHRREKLATLFWPEKSESEARTNLRRALADLRANIQDQTASPPFLLITRNDMQINLDSPTTIDCLLLEQQAHNGCKTLQDMELCDRLLALYRGEFLAGFSLPGCVSFDEWQSLVREQYHRMMVHVAEKAMQYLDQHQQYQRAIPYGRRLVSLAPWQEEPCRQLMQLLALVGDRQEALQQYEQLKATLAEELGLEPEPETTQLMETIRAGVFAECQGSPAVAPTPTIPEILSQEADTPTQLMQSFVGRKDVLAVLHEKLAAVLQSKHGSIHFIAGEAGSGKTWLGREFIFQALAKHPDLVAATGFCNAFTGTGDPYLPFREIFSQLCGDFEAQLRAGTVTRAYAHRLWKIRSVTAKIVLKYGQGLIRTIIPSYVFLNELSFQQFQFEEWYQELKALVHNQQNSVNTMQYSLMLSQLTKVLHKMAEVSPLILAIDDLHWADSGTLNLLMHLGKHLAGSPVLILCAFRSEDVMIKSEGQAHPLIPLLNDLQREYGDIITQLDEISGREFISDYLAMDPNNLPPDFVEYLYQITAGHALSVSELMRTFQENGSLVKDDQGRWVESGQRSFEQVPPKIEGILALRIQTLPQQTQWYLSIASIQGDIFNAEIIAEVSGQKKKKVIQLLNSAATHDHHLIQRQHQSLDEKEQFTAYKFRHILFQKYLYDNIDLAERRYLHEQVAYTLETFTADEPEIYAAQLARHFHEAGYLRKAITYYMQAGVRANKMIGFQEAANLFETALALNQQLPASEERDQQEIEIQMGICKLNKVVLDAGNEKVKKAEERIWELCKTLESDELRLDALEILVQTSQRLSDYERLGKIEALRKEIQSTMEGIPSIEKIRQALKDSYIFFRFGDYDSAIQSSKIAIEAYVLSKQLGNEAISGSVGNQCYTQDAEVSIAFGDFQRAIEDRNKIAQITKTLTDKIAIMIGNLSLMRINFFLGEIDNSELLLHQVQKILGDDYLNSARYETGARWAKSGLHLLRREYDEVVEELTTIIQNALSTGAMNGMTINHIMLAQAYFKKGDIDSAKIAITNAEKYQKPGETWPLHALARIRGNIFQAEGDLASAEEKYLLAIQISQEQFSKTHELYAVEDLCRLWHQQGKTQQAQQRLSAMLAQFEGQPNVGILREANEILREIGGLPKPSNP